ncbi:MAG: hypothetical protein NUW37_01400 [Planctomycetes bacterium]|nr:hypothetical protein [Planctomycetota bacterium]
MKKLFDFAFSDKWMFLKVAIALAVFLRLCDAADNYQRGWAPMIPECYLFPDKHSGKKVWMPRTRVLDAADGMLLVESSGFPVIVRGNFKVVERTVREEFDDFEPPAQVTNEPRVWRKAIETSEREPVLQKLLVRYEGSKIEELEDDGIVHLSDSLSLNVTFEGYEKGCEMINGHMVKGANENRIFSYLVSTPVAIVLLIMLMLRSRFFTPLALREGKNAFPPEDMRNERDR